MGYRIIFGLIAVFACVITGIATASPIGNDGRPQARAEQHKPKPKNEPKPSETIAIQNQVERIARALEAAIPKPTTTAEEDRAERNLKAQEGMVYWAKLMFWVGGAEILLTAFGVILIRQTLKATWVAAGEAKRAADAAHTAVEKSEEQARRELRAYVTMDKVEILLFSPGNPLRIKIRMVNCGQTPAMKYRGWHKVAILPAVVAVTYPFEESEFWSEFPLGPGMESIGYQTNFIDVTEEIFKSVVQRKSLIYVWGQDRYTDIFGTEQVMNFRYQHTGPVSVPHRMLTCNKGNNAT